MHESGFAVSSRRGWGHRGVLLLASLLLGTTGGVLDAHSAEARKVPTCRGVPATIVGTAKDDTIVGTDGDDVIVGGRGLDNISGGRGNDLICGGPTRVKEVEGDRVYQTLDGGRGNDTVIGGHGVDDIFGMAGSDVLLGRAGFDILMGDGDSRSGSDILRGGRGADEMNGNSGDDRVFGGHGADLLYDFDGANFLAGGDGSDVIDSGPGDETIKGGPGRDAASYVNLLEPSGWSSHCNDVIADLSTGTASGAGFGTDTLGEIESVWTGGGNDALIGDDGPNGFYTGFPCSDEPSPTESVHGHGGSDRIIFDSNKIDGSSAPGRVRVDLQEQSATWNNQGQLPPVLLTLDSIEDVTGTEYDDVIRGDAGRNKLAGGYGGDLIDGRVGADRLRGKQGNDRLDGGPGQDHNNGGPGVDVCLSPRGGAFAIRCER